MCDKVQANFKPVMHHFFLENFPTPQTWYEDDWPTPEASR